MKTTHKAFLMSAALAAAGLAGMVGQTSASTTYTWTGAGSDNLWSDSNNWLSVTKGGNGAPQSSDTSIVAFTYGTSNNTPDASAGYTLHQVLFQNSNSYTLTGSDLSFGVGTGTNGYITDEATSNETINNNLDVAPTGSGGYLTVGNESSGTLTLGGTISTNATTPGRLFLQSSTGTGAVVASGTLSGKFYQFTVGQYEGTSTTTLVNLTGNNSNFSAENMTVWTGILELSSANALGTTNTEILLNSGLGTGNPTLLTNAAMTVSNEIIVQSPTSMPTSPSTLGVNTIGGKGAYTSTFSGTIYMGYPYGLQTSPRVDTPLDLTADAGGTVTFSGNLLEPTYLNNVSINSNVTKIGTGTVILSGSGNNYQGTTEVQAGTLLVNGTLLSGGGTVTVDSGATLGGTGTIDRSVAVFTGGILSPGDAVGTFTLSSLSLANGSNLAFTLGSSSDLVSTDALTLGTSVALTVTQGTGFGLGTYKLIDYTSLVDNSSGFSGWTVSGLSVGEIGVFSLSGSEVNLTVESSSIPEPSALGLLALGSLGILAVRRRRSA